MSIAWPWQYEPFSIMLESGIPYTPDFWIPRPIQLIVECRGYETERSRRQLKEYSELIRNSGEGAADLLYLPDHSDIISDYVIIGPEHASTHAFRMRGYRDGAFLGRCQCGWWSLIGGSWGICSARCSDGRIVRAEAISINQGKILLNGKGVEDFDA